MTITTVTKTLEADAHPRRSPLRPAKVIPASTPDHAGWWFWLCRMQCLDGHGWVPTVTAANQAARDHVARCDHARAMLAATAGLAS